MHTIQGPIEVNLNDYAAYNVTPADGTSYAWTVVGCTILDGQGTSAIDVQWTTVGQGVIQVEVTNSSGVDIIVIDPTCS